MHAARPFGFAPARGTLASMTTMSLRERHAALLDLRDVARDLGLEDVRLLHRIAASFVGAAADFRAGVLAEFAAARNAARPAVADDVMGALQRALGRRSSAVWDTVQRIKAAWPELGTATRAAVLNEIDAAMAQGDAGGSAEIALWREVLALPFEGERADGLIELQRRAAVAVYEARRGGPPDPDADWAVSGDSWFLVGPPGEEPFTVAFEPGTAILRGGGPTAAAAATGRK